MTDLIARLEEHRTWLKRDGQAFLELNSVELSALIRALKVQEAAEVYVSAVDEYEWLNSRDAVPVEVEARYDETHAALVRAVKGEQP